VKRIFLIASTFYDFGDTQIKAPACPTIASGNYLWHTVEVKSLRTDRVNLVAQIIKGSNSDAASGWNFRDGIIYKISGRPLPRDSSGNCYLRTRIDIRVYYSVNNFCDSYPQTPGNPAFWPSQLWHSPIYPTNEWFWYCVVSQRPEVFQNQVVNAQVGFPLNYPVELIDPLVRVPESISATGLPPGITLRYSTQQPIIRQEVVSGSGTVHYPGDILPILIGTPTVPGVYTVTITASNPIGSTSATVTLSVSPPPPDFIAVGNQGAASFYTGNTPVDALYLGSSKVYP
jgi:hypothetical protein